MLSKTKKVTVLAARLEDAESYALLYSCATNWWMIFPRKTEATWLISRKSAIVDGFYNELK